MLVKNLQFVEISVDEISQIQQLAFKIFPETYQKLLTKEQIDYMLEMMYSENSLLKNFEEGCRFFVLKNDFQNIGYGSISVDNEVVTLHKIYIDSAFQGMNLGRKFINYLEEVGLMAGGKALQLYVNRENIAKNFYVKIGYSIIKAVDKNIGNGYWMNDYLMEKEIGNRQ